MKNFGIMMGGIGEFNTTLENRLQNFQKGSDYYTYDEVSGRSRKKHYVVCSERLANDLAKVDWGNLKGFRKIEVGEETNNSPADDEEMKFVVEKFVNEWLDYYETTKPGAYFKRYLTNPTFGNLKDRDNLRIEFEKEKKDKDLSSGVYRSSWKFDKDGLVNKDEAYLPNNLNQNDSSNVPKSNISSKTKKHCSGCKVDREVSLNDNFCGYCGQSLTDSNRFDEVDNTKGGFKKVASPQGWKGNVGKSDKDNNTIRISEILAIVGAISVLIIGSVVVVKKQLNKKKIKK